MYTRTSMVAALMCGALVCTPVPALALSASQPTAAQAAEQPAALPQQKPKAASPSADDQTAVATQSLALASAATQAAQLTQADDGQAVTTADEFTARLQQIAQGSDSDATIVLGANISLQDGFAGVAGKRITVQSAGENSYTLTMARCLVGDVTLDNVTARLYNEYHKDAGYTVQQLFACGHAFETTANFKLTSRDNSFLYGGGPSGTDVAGDTSLVIRDHADWSYIYGGGYDSAVSGSTSVLIDDANAVVDNVFGGGRAEKTHSGTVGGDARVTVRQGRVKHLFGGGQNVATDGTDDRTPAAVTGTAYVTSGYQGATGHVATIGSASFAHGGSWHSTVGNVRFSMLEGTWDSSGLGGRSYYGCGLHDVVRGTVEMSVDVSDDGMLDATFFGGAEDDPFDVHGASNGAVQILNEDGKDTALTISYNASEGTETSDYAHDILAGCDGDIDMQVKGGMQINIEGGNIRQAVLDSYGMLTAEASQVKVTGGRVLNIQGLENHFKGDADAPKDTVLFTGAGTADAPVQVGYIYGFEGVDVKDSSNVVVDASNFGRSNKPFYSVNGLTVEEASALTLGNGQAWVYGDVAVDGSLTQTYKQGDDYNDLYVKGATTVGPNGLLVDWGTANLADEVTNSGTMAFMQPAYMQGDYAGDDGTICLPLVTNNYDGTDDGGDIPLAIEGLADGDTFVKIVASDDYTKLAMPALGQNYIVQAEKSMAKRRSFRLRNEDALMAGLFLDNVDDPAADSDGWVWQVANGISVIFELNEGVADQDPWAIESEEHHAGESLLFEEPEDPVREGYTFEGWNTQADGSGTAFTDKTRVGRSTYVYAQWKKTGSDEPGDNPGAGDKPGTGDVPGGTDTPGTGENPGSPSDAGKQPVKAASSASKKKASAKAGLPGTGDTANAIYGIVAAAGAFLLAGVNLLRRRQGE